MRCLLAVVGKPRDAGLAAAIEAYETRAARYWPLEVKEVREERSGSLSPVEVRAREGARLRAATTGARVIACDEGGTAFTSTTFARWLQKQREAARDIAFVIGGAFGLDHALRDAAAVRLTLAPWTLPHELARLVLAEQLYRAGTIGRGEPYHK